MKSTVDKLTTLSTLNRVNWFIVNPNPNTDIFRYVETEHFDSLVEWSELLLNRWVWGMFNQLAKLSAINKCLEDLVSGGRSCM